MTFLLSSDNVLHYLVERGLCCSEECFSAQVVAKEYKNFNLLVSLNEGRHFLVKQERPNAEGKSRNDLWFEWRMHEFLHAFAELGDLHPHVSEVIHFDPEYSIAVLKYFNQYSDLAHFYAAAPVDAPITRFPVKVAGALGTVLAKIHQRTFQNLTYQNFLAHSKSSGASVRIPRFLRGLERVGPGLFSHIQADGIDFWRLYQRFDSLHQAMVDATVAFKPCCLTHNDLRLWNILVNLDWNTLSAQQALITPSIKLIDWEFYAWGDPAYDLGMLFSGYLKLWLRSLVLSKAIPLEAALRLATTPLEWLQPSLLTLIQAYLAEFPEILTHFPDFVSRVMQFTGLVLLKRIQGKLEQFNPFDNSSIATLQVAKTLLCHPEQSVVSVLGTSVTELMATTPLPIAVR
jgi:hypothetical protein